MALTEAKLKAYQVIFRMMMQFILIVCALIAFFIVLYYLIHTTKEDSAAKTYSLSASELLLTGTIFRVFWHYFPSKEADAEAKKTGKEKAKKVNK